jgi:hypothetical protein
MAAVWRYSAMVAGPRNAPHQGESMALNLALRFLLELAALGGFALLAWRSANGGWRVIAVISVCLLVMTLWGVFNVPDDPSRSGHAPVPVPGVVRLLLELVILFGAVAAFCLAGEQLTAAVMAALLVLHYVLSVDRIVWLLQQ